MDAAGYIRVSSRGQHYEMQRHAIDRAAAARGDVLATIYAEKRTATTMERPELERLRAEVRAGRVKRIYVRGTKTETRDRHVPLTDDVRVIAAKARPGPLIERWGNVGCELVEACEKLKIPRCSSNDLRRTYCTWLLLAGMPPEHVARLLGHTDTRMVYSVYGRIRGEHLVEVAGHIKALLQSPGDALLQVSAHVEASPAMEP
jgi:integrase